MPCVKRPLNGSEISMPAEPLEGAGPETRVEQVQDRMLYAADILAQRAAMFSASSRSNGLSAGWLAKRMKYQLESTKVSSVSVSRTAPPGAGSGKPHASSSGGGRAGFRHFKVDIVRKDDRRAYRAAPEPPAGRAVNNRNRSSPITLARYAPVAQAILYRAPAPAGFFSPSNNLPLPLWSQGHRESAN